MTSPVQRPEELQLGHHDHRARHELREEQEEPERPDPAPPEPGQQVPAWHREDNGDGDADGRRGQGMQQPGEDRVAVEQGSQRAELDAVR
jgi:hypothetical protein